jgi:hypothetical protein
MRGSITSYAVAVLSAGWLLAAPPAMAQGQPAAPSISDQKLDQAAAAIKNITRIHKDYEQKLSAAPPDQQDQIAEEGNAALQKAVTDQGLSVEEYNTIIQTAQNNPALRERLGERLGEMEK